MSISRIRIVWRSTSDVWQHVRASGMGIQVVKGIAANGLRKLAFRVHWQA